MNSVDETAKEMNVLASAKDKLMQGLNIYQSISMMKYYREMGQSSQDINNAASAEINLQTSFTGQHTDIALMDANGGKVELDDILNIEDDTLRQNTVENFENAVRDGYAEFDLSENAYRLTDKGREHINREAFMEQFQKDRLNYIESQNLAQVKLRGNKNDLSVFRYADSFNLNRLMANPRDLKRVVSYMQLCEDYDFVNISSDGTVMPTDKCKVYLSQNPDCNIEITKVTAGNAESLASRGAADTGKRTAERGVAKAAAKEVGKTAAQTGVEESGKKAAKTAIKAGAKTAAKASSAAATAGTGAAVSAVVKLSEKGVKMLKPDNKGSTIKAAGFKS